MPEDYKKILEKVRENKDKGMTDEDAEIEAFYSVTKG